MLKSTYKGAGLDKAVTVHETVEINLPNNNFIKIYTLPIIGNDFDHYRLKDVIANNIKNYVFSRKEIAEAEIEETGDALYHKAIEKFREIKNEKDNGNGAEIGEIMLYLFMEHDLNAPKIFSKMELKTNRNDYIKGADGVFLHQYNKENKKVFDLVIGESKVKNKITKAIDTVFDSINDHIKNVNFEINLINENIFKETFNKEEAEDIKRMIIPTGDINENEIKKRSFGVFIGYSLDCDLSNIASEDVPKVIKERVSKDIKEISEKVIKKIIKENLNKYSFYVYLLPLKNAEADKKNLMKYIIG